MFIEAHNEDTLRQSKEYFDAAESDILSHDNPAHAAEVAAKYFFHQYAIASGASMKEQFESQHGVINGRTNVSEELGEEASGAGLVGPDLQSIQSHRPSGYADSPTGGGPVGGVENGGDSQITEDTVESEDNGPTSQLGEEMGQKSDPIPVPSSSNQSGGSAAWFVSNASGRVEPPKDS